MNLAVAKHAVTMLTQKKQACYYPSETHKGLERVTFMFALPDACLKACLL